MPTEAANAANASPPANAAPPAAAVDTAAEDAAHASPADVSAAASGGAASAAHKPENSVGFALRQERAARKALESQLQEVRGSSSKEVETLRGQVAELTKVLDAFKADPIVAAAKAGANVEESIRSFVEKTKPEQLAAEATRQIAELKKEIAEKDRAAKEDLDKQQRAFAERSASAAVDNFTRALVAGADKYPHLNAECTPQEIRAAVVHAQQLAREGRLPPESQSFEAFAALLEKDAEKLHTLRQQRREKLLAAKAAPGSDHRAKNGQSRSTATEKPAGQSAGTEAPRGAAPKKSFRSRNLIPADELAADLAALKTATAKDRATAEKKPVPAAKK